MADYCYVVQKKLADNSNLKIVAVVGPINGTWYEKKAS